MRWPFNNQAARQPRNRVVVPGWAPPALKDGVRDLEQQMAMAQLRVDQARLKNVPGAIKGEKLFTPSVAARTVNAVSVRDICLSGQTYDVEVPYNAAGVFIARSMVVNVSFRQVVSDNSQTPYVLWHNTRMANAANAAGWGLTTNLALFGTGTTSPESGNAAPISYMWNLEDPRSGKRVCDDLVSGMALLPPFETASGFTPGSRLMFDAPWLLERDSQLRFMFRPLMDIVESASISESRTLRLRVEIHGTRFFTDQDAMRKGALIP